MCQTTKKSGKYDAGNGTGNRCVQSWFSREFIFLHLKKKKILKIIVISYFSNNAEFFFKFYQPPV